MSVLATVVAGHVIALAVALANRSSLPPRLPNPPALSLIAVDTTLSPPIAALPPRLASKLPTPDPSPPPQPPAASSESALSIMGQAATSCVALDEVAIALLADPAALGSILHAPRETRSIADAIVIWNAQWSEAAIAADAPLEPVRASVQATLSSVDQSCLDEPIVGPRLVPIPAGDGTTFLVFGSGSWSWRQLLPAAQGKPR